MLVDSVFLFPLLHPFLSRVDFDRKFHQSLLFYMLVDFVSLCPLLHPFLLDPFWQFLFDVHVSICPKEFVYLFLLRLIYVQPCYLDISCLASPLVTQLVLGSSNMLAMDSNIMVVHWGYVLILEAAINTLAAAVYAVFASGELLDWAKDQKADNIEMAKEEIVVE